MFVAVTGANGFVGRHLCCRLVKENFKVLGLVRTGSFMRSSSSRLRIQEGFSLEAPHTVEQSLRGVDVLVHCAAVNNANRGTGRGEFNLNESGTLALAQCAARAGVKRFILLSSVKVFGYKTPLITHKSPFSPSDYYASSKLKSQIALQSFCKASNLTSISIYSPPVYGVGSSGNIARLFRLVQLGIPIPVCRPDNPRSLIGINNLVDCIIRCVTVREAPEFGILVSDKSDISISDFASLISQSVQKKSYKFFVPRSLVRLASLGMGRPEIHQVLTNCQRVDIGYTELSLAWSPPFSIQRQIDWMLQ
jgi:UDP-glucose 4-epimerase